MTFKRFEFCKDQRCSRMILSPGKVPPWPPLMDAVNIKFLEIFSLLSSHWSYFQSYCYNIRAKWTRYMFIVQRSVSPSIYYSHFHKIFYCLNESLSPKLKITKTQHGLPLKVIYDHKVLIEQTSDGQLYLSKTRWSILINVLSSKHLTPAQYVVHLLHSWSQTLSIRHLKS